VYVEPLKQVGVRLGTGRLNLDKKLIAHEAVTQESGQHTLSTTPTLTVVTGTGLFFDHNVGPHVQTHLDVFIGYTHLGQINILVLTKTARVPA
jgi:hypothetical protein